ncbi:MAG: anthranilate synthase component I family protein [Sporomusaceae bacterium]|nr:anthranilate synthase component I family protein [Sporomusaceae bacterium]
MNIYPGENEFSQLAQEFTLIPVYTELAADLDTPISFYYKLVGDQAGFILESVETGKTFGRYSFIGAEPFATFTCYKTKTNVVENDPCPKEYILPGTPKEVLQSYLNNFKVPSLPGLPPFMGGAVGYFAYESVATFERVRGLEVDDNQILSQLLFCRILVVMDHLTHVARLVYLATIKPGEDSAIVYQKACTELEAVKAKLQQNTKLVESESEAEFQNIVGQQPAVANDDYGKIYMDLVEKAKEYIKAGDIFQVVLSQPFCRKLNQPPFAIYRSLRRLNPSPYLFYINFGQEKIVGASPEMLVKVENKKVYTCPIAGTRPRQKDEAENQRLAEEMACDAKEVAEHAMLVDLGRNDIGRVSIPGTVKVDQLMTVEHFSHVMHMVSHVSGTLKEGLTALDVLAACFPAGTLSGAPKVRAMEIIAELEQNVRGFYGGAVGYIDYRGNMNTCIAIRTLFIDGDAVSIRTGAGIVADSVPETEYQEVLAKGKILFQVMGE